MAGTSMNISSFNTVDAKRHEMDLYHLLVGFCHLLEECPEMNARQAPSGVDLL